MLISKVRAGLFIKRSLSSHNPPLQGIRKKPPAGGFLLIVPVRGTNPEFSLRVSMD